MRGAACLVGAVLCVVAAVLVLPSCAEMPVTVGVESNYGTLDYSAKGGLRARVDAGEIERRLREPRAVRAEK